MNKHIVTVVFVVEDQEDVSIDKIKHQFAFGYMATYNGLGESFTYEPKSVVIVTIDNDMSIDTKVYGYD